VSWKSLQMDLKIAKVLDVNSHKRPHHFGRPFMTPYQIALGFKDCYPEDFKNIGKPIGGKKTGRYDSLSQYIALELSKGIKKGRINNIEGRFLYRGNLKSLKYEKGAIVASSGQGYDLSMYRLKDSKCC
jgi:hypothetical protein